jgi:hypothetical protein
MTNRRRIPLEEVLQAALPGRVQATQMRGFWSTIAGQAEWELEPDGGGYWLVLSGALKAAEPLTDLFNLAGHWAWPLKVSRREPRAPALWCAEMRLVGAAGEGACLGQLVGLIEKWLSGGDGANSSSSPVGDEPSRNASSALANDVLVRALGDSLKRTSQGYRLPVPDGPALAITPHQKGWVFRTTLVRAAGPLTAPLLASLSDFLAVANGKVRGCRAVGDRTQPETVAELETRIAGDSLTTGEIRAAAASLTRTARLVAPACEVLVGQPPVGAFYREVFFGEKAVCA